jgi:hypothetical protein
MNQSPTFDDYADRLRTAREALDDDRTGEALDVFLEIRESGVFSDALDRQIQELSQQPDGETIEAVGEWIDDVIAQIERRGGDVFSRIEEVSETVGGIDEQSELVPLSESSDVGIELMEMSEVNDQGEGFFDEGDGISVDESGASAKGEERAAFSRDSEPITAVGHDDLSDYESDEVEQTDRSMEGADADFERLPSVDFAVVDSEEDEPEEIPDEQPSGSGSTGEDVTEGLKTDANSIQSSPADLSDESTSAQSEGGGEFDVFGDGGDIASSFSVDEQEGGQQESSGFSFEPDSSPGEVSAGGIEDIDFDEGFGEESAGGEESDGFVFESDPDDDDEWSGFGDIDSEPSAEGTEAGFDFAGGEESDDDMFGESGLFGGDDSDDTRQTRKQDAIGVEEGEDDFDFGFGDDDKQEDEDVLGAGGASEEEASPGEPQAQDPNQTRQPFSDDREVEAYAQNSVESPGESVGPDRRSDSLLGDGGRNLKESGFPDGPDEVDENEKTKGPFDKESHTPVGESPSPPSQVSDDEEEQEEEGFDLGFENPGGDDAAGFELDAETGVGPSDAQMAEMSSPTPVPGEQQQEPAGMSDESTNARRREEEGSFAAPGQPRAEGEAGTNPPASPESEGPGRQVGPSPDDVTSTQQGIELFDEEETGSSDPLSDDEFFQLADELSEPESGGGSPQKSAPESPPGGSEPEEWSDGGTAQSPGVVEGAASSRPNSGPVGPSPEPADAVSQTTHGMPAGGEHLEESGESDSEFEEEQRATSQPPGSFIYDQAGESADESSAEISGGAIRLIEEAERLVGEGNLDSAHDVVQSVLDQNPESDRAQSLLDAIEEERGDDEPAASPTEKLGSMDNVPEREISMGEVANRDLDHRYGFILSLVDGQMTIDDILELSSMSRSETLDVLSGMLDESIISLNK